MDGVPGTSSTNVVTGAIPGVTLNLTGVTTTSGAVTVNVCAPAADASKVETAMNQFITDYNAALSAMQTQLAQKPTSSDPTQGSLFGDNQLKGLMASMRSLMVKSGDGLPTDWRACSTSASAPVRPAAAARPRRNSPATSP